MGIGRGNAKVGLDLRSCLFTDLPNNRLDVPQIYQELLDLTITSDSVLRLIHVLATRAEWQELRLKSYNDNISLSNEQIAEQAKVFAEHNGLLKASIPGHHPTHGKEPHPFVNVDSRRFINDDWCEWYSKVTNNVNRSAVLSDCCKRGMELLYPTDESRKGLEWELGVTAGKVSMHGFPIYPMEVAFYRTVLQKV